MPSTTTLGYPYPVPGDPVADEAAKVQELAQYADDQVGLIKKGSATSGVLVAGVATTVAVVFPVAFPVGTTPIVVACLVSPLAAVNVFCGVQNVTRLGFDLIVRRDTGTASLTGAWIAVVQ